jgi:hypothetical protein
MEANEFERLSERQSPDLAPVERCAEALGARILPA